MCSREGRLNDASLGEHTRGSSGELFLMSEVPLYSLLARAVSYERGTLVISARESCFL